MGERKRRILLVDDNADLRKLYGKRLEAAGYEVAESADGEQALAQILEHPPDLLVLDVMLPKLNGYELCARLKKGRATRRIPIVMFTAKIQPEDHIEGIIAGADSYVSKLCPAQELLDRIKMLLGSTPQLSGQHKSHTEAPGAV